MDKSKLQLVRGERVLQQLEEVTLTDLERNIVFGFPNTKKRQHATDPVVIAELKLTPYTNSTDLLADAVAKSNESGKTYDPKVLFLDVVFQDEDTGDNITFTGSDGDIHNMTPISLSKSNVKVRCNCMDFYRRFASWNGSKGALFGKTPLPHQKVPGSNRGPANPEKVPGLCKHVIKTVQAMREAGLVKD